MENFNNNDQFTTHRVAISIGVLAILIQLASIWSIAKDYLSNQPILIFAFTVLVFFAAFGFIPYLFLLALSLSPDFFMISFKGLKSLADYFYSIGAMFTIFLLFVLFGLLFLNFLIAQVNSINISLEVVGLVVSVLINAFLIFLLITKKI